MRGGYGDVGHLESAGQGGSHVLNVRHLTSRQPSQRELHEKRGPKRVNPLSIGRICELHGQSNTAGKIPN